MKRRSLFVLVGLLALVVVVVGALDFFARDRCLDAGGSWQTEKRTCEGAHG